MEDAHVEKSDSVNFEAEAKKLRKYFKFTEADLTANRNGALSEKQKDQIRKLAGSARKWALIIGIILLGVAVYGVFGFKTDFFGIFPALIWGLVWGIPGVLLTVLGISSTPQFELLNVRGRAKFVRGTTSRRNRRASVYYDLYINEQEFDGDGDHFPKTLIEGAEYVVYYTKGAQQIVSAELISAPN